MNIQKHNAEMQHYHSIFKCTFILGILSIASACRTLNQSCRLCGGGGGGGGRGDEEARKKPKQLSYLLRPRLLCILRPRPCVSACVCVRVRV